MRQTTDQRRIPFGKNALGKLFRYQPSQLYFARIRIKGKLIRRRLKNCLSRLADKRGFALIFTAGSSIRL
jgi:hypothetical protein